jgi:hypothetical protein
VRTARRGAAQAVIQQRGQHRAIALALEGRTVGRRQQRARLVVTDRRRFAFLAGHLRPLDAVDRVALDRVSLAQCIEQRRQGRQLAADRRAGERAQLQGAAPGENVAAADLAEGVRILDAGECHEFAHVVFVGAAGLRVIDVGEPGDCRRHIGQLVEVVDRQRARRSRGHERIGVFGIVDYGHLRLKAYSSTPRCFSTQRLPSSIVSR